MRDTPAAFGKLRSNPVDPLWPDLDEAALWILANQIFVFREQGMLDVQAYEGPTDGWVEV
jgi:hypothetical protein